MTRQHGEFVEAAFAPHVTATGHPSAILRARDDATRERLMRELVEDLGKVARVLDGK